MLGGMSWESTSTYYRLLNEGVKAELGGLHSARLCLYSVDFAEIETLQHRGDWARAATELASAAQSIQAGGADFLMICTNTMHKVADEIQASINIPVLHIADATALQLLKDGINCVGLLGTRFTMQEDFYKGRLQDKHGINVLVPGPVAQEKVHQVIYNELCLGIIKDESRNDFIGVIDQLRTDGAEAIILGCTEIAMLIRPEDTEIALYDTTEIHCQAALELALN